MLNSLAPLRVTYNVSKGVSQIKCYLIHGMEALEGTEFLDLETRISAGFFDTPRREIGKRGVGKVVRSVDTRHANRQAAGTNTPRRS